MEQARNLLLAIVISMGIVWIWQILFPPPKPPVQQAEQAQPADSTKQQAAASAKPQAKKVHSAAPQAPSWKPTKRRFVLENDVLRLVIDDRGRIVRAVLKRYKTSLEEGAPSVAYVDLTDRGHGMYLGAGVLGHALRTPFRLLKRGQDWLRIEAELDDGTRWQREFRLTNEGGGYLIRVRDLLFGEAARFYRQVVERNPDRKKNTFYEHVGPIALIDGKLVEIDYDELDESKAIRRHAQGGWIGIMDRYFIAAYLLPKQRPVELFFRSDGANYQAGLIDTLPQQSEGVMRFEAALYLGPKSIPVMETLGVELERCVDFGWFAFIAKPLHSFLLWVHRFVPNYGWDIVLLVVLIKLLFFWPTKKSYESMAAMRKIQPELERLRELYGDDRQRLGEELMKLYRKHKVNPLGGCLPIAVQIPVFFALYKVLLMSIEMRHAPFTAWIQDLSAPDPYFVLPVLMGLSMYVQQKLNPKPSDPMQAKLMQFMPPAFTLMFLFFPSGLVLYWFVNNLLSIAQQWYVMKKMQAL